jgi:hypothetical protein
MFEVNESMELNSEKLVSLNDGIIHIERILFPIVYHSFSVCWKALCNFPTIQIKFSDLLWDQKRAV